MTKLLQGWKTIIFGLIVALLPAGLNYFLSIDWTHYVSPNVALIITGVITLLLRTVTTTSVGKKD